jgi:hypothetical protein
MTGGALRRQAASAAVGLACGLLGLVFAYRSFESPWRAAWLAGLAVCGLPGMAFLLFTPAERSFARSSVRRGLVRGMARSLE